MTMVITQYKLKAMSPVRTSFTAHSHSRQLTYSSLIRVAVSVSENKRFFIGMFPPPPSTSMNSILVQEGYALACKISLE